MDISFQKKILQLLFLAYLGLFNYSLIYAKESNTKIAFFPSEKKAYYIIDQKKYNINPVDINHANAQEIAQKLYGIGKKKSNAIIEYRKKHGDFKTPYDLTKVKGIGKKTVEKNLLNILIYHY